MTISKVMDSHVAWQNKVWPANLRTIVGIIYIYISFVGTNASIRLPCMENYRMVR